MENNNELNKVDIKNRTCYYFDDIIDINNFDLDNILLDEKSYENTLIYDVVYKILFCAKPLQIIYEKKNGWIFEKI